MSSDGEWIDARKRLLHLNELLVRAGGTPWVEERQMTEYSARELEEFISRAAKDLRTLAEGG